MRRATPHHPDHARLLADPSWSHCEELIKSFEEAWRRGAAPAIDDYLTVSGSARHPLLIELAHVDLEFRLKAGETAWVEDYLGRYPELAKDRAATLELLAAEYELRKRGTEDISSMEYSVRFPDLLDDLLALVLQNARASAPPSTDPDKTEAGPLPHPAVPGYEVEAELGRGGMGVVYKARDARLDRSVALKLLPAEYARDPDRLERFLHEARTASALNHPHICTIHALGEHEGRPFIVMELIEGRTLQTLVSQRVGTGELAGLIGQAARALAAAHAAGVVHRDVKPENIMVREDGYVKVLDFGLARRLPTLVPGTSGAGPDTAPGMFVGTAAYMAPEQARGEAAGSASDVFALGIVLYQLATGTHPFEGESPLAMLQAIATQRAISPSRLNPEVPAALQGLIEAMLQKDPRLRPTAAEVADVLASLSGGARPGGPAAPRTTVGREPERAALRTALAEAEAGRATLVCLAGEPGIGKTTLAEDFLRELPSEHGCLVGRGYCSERLADAEAYLPVLECLEDLLSGTGGASLARLMRVVAPAWRARVTPTGATASTPPSPEQATPADSQLALRREFCNFLREASRLGTLVLFLDDVHWADLSTVDLLAHLGRQRDGLRVLGVLTYRPTELLLGPHPFHGVKLELQGHGACREVRLGFLDREAIDRYLSLTFPDHAFPENFAGLIHARTEGSPLFLVDLLAYLRERGVIAEEGGRWVLARDVPVLPRELPESVRGMIERKIGRLTEDDRRLLAAAAVQGSEFDSAVVAGALNRDAAEIEERLQALERVHALVRLVREHEFPDHTLSQRYRFVHILYQHALHDALPPTRRATLSVALARTLEGHHGTGSPAVVAELACLYEAGRDFARAARQFRAAAQHAADVFGHQEAVALARRGLRQLSALRETPERAELELPLQVTLGMQLQMTEGFAAPEAGQAYERARELCRQLPGDSPPFPVLWGQWLFLKVRSELARARELAEELQTLARRLNDPALALQAQQALAVTSLCRGEPSATVRHMEQAVALYDQVRHRSHSTLFGQDPAVACKAFSGVALWLLGHPDEAVRQSDAALRLSHQLLQPSSQALALHFAAMLHQCRRHPRRVLACVEVTTAIASEHRFSFWLAGAAVLRGWALAAEGAADEGIGVLRQGLHDWLATGSITYQTYYLGLLAEVLLHRGRVEEGQTVLEEALALAGRTGEGLYEAELHRLRGELLLCGPEAPGAAERAEEEYRRALEVARRQGARSLELRAAMSLARLGQRLGRVGEARPLLAEVYGQFTEGLDTPDLKKARALLDSLR